jgi:hypothetical protein
MFTEIAAIVLGVSLANDRILEMLKTIIPWLTVQKSSTEDNGEVSLEEMLRRLLIQIISFASGWVSAGIVAAKDNAFMDLGGDIPIGDKMQVPVVIVGILSSAGSTFWTQIVSYSKALKDEKKSEAADERIEMTKKVLEVSRTNKYQVKMQQINQEQAPNFN